jgi:hypothetical protein
LKVKAFLALIIVVALCGLGLTLHRRSIACKERRFALIQRLETLKRDVHDTLTPGTKKDVVVRFLAKRNIHQTAEGDQVWGRIRTSGCAPFGCTSDAFFIVVRVDLDDAGTVKSEPTVSGIYTDCM